MEKDIETTEPNIIWVCVNHTLYKATIGDFEFKLKLDQCMEMWILIVAYKHIFRLPIQYEDRDYLMKNAYLFATQHKEFVDKAEKKRKPESTLKLT